MNFLSILVIFFVLRNYNTRIRFVNTFFKSFFVFEGIFCVFLAFSSILEVARNGSARFFWREFLVKLLFVEVDRDDVSDIIKRKLQFFERIAVIKIVLVA